jgi:MATE family, multidrug efflux pump
MSNQSIAIPLLSPASPAPIKPEISARPAAARTRLLLEAPVLSTLLRLSAPNVLNLLAIAGMITFDGLFLGRLGPDALAGVSLAFPFVMLIQHTAASGMGGGVSSAIARALGAGKRDVADALVFHTFVLALALAATFSAVLLIGAPFIFRWMGGHGEMLSAALAYSNVAFSAAASICMLNLLGSAVRGTGNMSLPAAVIVGSVIAHVLISPLMIFGWGPLPALGPAGAGWGLMISFGAGSLVLLGYLRSRRSLVTLVFRGVSLRWQLFAEILKVGVPGLVNVLITNVSVVLLTGIAGHLGREVAIGYAMGARLEYILIPLAFGFGTAIVAMVGTNWGARQYRRARTIAWTGAATVGAACAAIGLVVALSPDLWMRLVPAYRGADLRSLWPRHGALFRHPGFRQRDVDCDGQRRPSARQHGVGAGRDLPARSRCDRILHRHRRGVLRLRGADRRSDVPGEGAVAAAAQVIVADRIDRSATDASTIHVRAAGGHCCTRRHDPGGRPAGLPARPDIQGGAISRGAAAGAAANMDRSRVGRRVALCQ